MAKKKDDPISKALDIAESFLIDVDEVKTNELSTKIAEREVGTTAPTEQDFIDDLNYARNTIHELIQKGGKVLNDAILVASESKHPRALEVAANILKQISELSQDLIDLSSKASQNEGNNSPKEQHNHIHCTTEDLGKILSTMKEAK